jgi:5-methylcytosine-specific restriction endonuclease McrA
MTWGKLGQEWPDDDRTAGTTAAGKGLYAVALCIANRAGTNGLLSGRILAEALMKTDFANDVEQRKALKSLVASGSWHDHKTATACRSDYCAMYLEREGPLPKGAYLICEFAKDQPSRDQQLVPMEHLRWLRDQDLTKNRRLCEQVQLRDRDLCRYCGGAAGVPGQPVNWSDRRGARGATYDHVDPFCADGFRGYGNTPENVVVACRQCNGRKRDRTPEQAGMVLLPAPGSEPSPDLIATRSGSSADSPSRARGARDGTDRDGTQSRLGPRVEALSSNGNGSNGNGSNGRHG